MSVYDKRAEEDTDVPNQSSFAAKLQADVLDTDATSFVVTYPDGSIETEPKNLLNSACFSADMADLNLTDPTNLEIEARHEFDTEREWGSSMQVRAVPDDHHVVVQVEQNRARMFGDHQSNVIQALVSAINSSNHDTSTHDGTISVGLRTEHANVIYSAFEQLMANKARPEVVAQYAPQFPDIVDADTDGWLIDDELLVTMDANVVDPDSGVSFVDLTFDAPTSATPDETGSWDAAVSQRELEFLATVTCLIESEEYLDVRLFGDHETDIVRVVREVAATVEQDDYRDYVSGRAHGHALNKHTVADIVTDDVIDALHYNVFDHAGPHEIVARRAEFEQADFDVFDDIDPEAGWSRLERAQGGARISKETQQHIAEIARQQA